MKRIAIDMDEVMADTAIDHLELFNREYGEHVTLEELEGTTLAGIRPLLRNEIESYFASGQFFRGLKVIPGSQDVIRELQEHYEVFIATAAMEVPASFRAKYEWLKEHFAFIPDSHLVFCGNKSIIHADYLLDDSVKQLNRFKGTGILYSAAHNKFETGFIRVNNWHEVRELLLGEGAGVRL
ncbi:5' nucleotidase, NT5C type [Paenibacillus pinihumi]|uniref:5' nucleotidase, NT5C type n=1 Tax=Paenibacillus pinihumi TaxID=669462 RepID=UPI000403DF4C|nr:5'-3'-deoxyribonucleotidase [Paenibacillus pinihumi]